MRSSKGGVLLVALVSLCLPVTSLAARHKTRSARPTAASPTATKPTAAKPVATKVGTRPIRMKVAKLTAEQIVRKHVAARGGLNAWHAVQSMEWKGEMEVGYGDSVARSERYVSNAMLMKGKGPRPAPAGSGHAKQVEVPFVLEMKRPAKSRVEIVFAGKTAVQVYDGANGWLKRPYLNREDWEPFTAEQASSQQGKWDLDGPLMDHASQGTKVEFVKVEAVEGRPAYELKLTHRNGEVQHVWIDAKSFLDVKIEGTPRRMDGKMRTVWVTQRDFRRVQGLRMPFSLETAVDGYPDTHKTTIDKVTLNPRLDDASFTKPRA